MSIASSSIELQKFKRQKVHPTSGNPFPHEATVSYHKLSQAHKAFVTSIISHIELHSYNEALEPSDWCKAMQSKIDALEWNQTWVLTNLPDGKSTIGCKIKYNSDGSVERYTARLVTKGYT